MNEKDINISKMIEEIVVKIVKETLEKLMNAERQAFIEEHITEQRMDIITDIWPQSLAISMI